MTISLDDFQRLKRKVESLQRTRDKAIGAKEEILKRLKEEFGCASLEEAKEKLARMRRKEMKLLTAYTASKKAFEEKWKAVLENKT